MDIKQLEALGISADELTNRIVDKAVESILTSTGYDEDGEEHATQSALARKVQDRIASHIDAKIKALADDHILPNISQYIDTLTLQETNKWGERTGTKLTFIEYLVQRADAYMREEVDYEGKAKGETGGYSWKKRGTRVAHMVNKHLHYSIEMAMTQALSQANSSISKGLEEAVKIALSRATEGLKVSVQNKAA